MDKEEIAFRKMAMLAEALKQLEQQERDEALEELKPAAFEVLLLHPGCNLPGWCYILCEQYQTELVDCFGRNPADINNGIARLWRTPYTDIATGQSATYEQWAERLSSGEEVEKYYNTNKKNG